MFHVSLDHCDVSQHETYNGRSWPSTDRSVCRRHIAVRSRLDRPGFWSSLLEVRSILAAGLPSAFGPMLRTMPTDIGSFLRAWLLGP